MFGLPPYAWFFVFAIIAAAVARVLVGRVRDDAASFPGWILYAVAIGCVILGIATYWLGRAG
jgi:fluoride ion exporter CrcB/FEX